jgi:hypothetical protein
MDYFIKSVLTILSSNLPITKHQIKFTIKSIFRGKPSETDCRFEVLTAVIMESYNFWDITSCSPLKVNVPPKSWFNFNELHGVIS